MPEPDRKAELRSEFRGLRQALQGAERNRAESDISRQLLDLLQHALPNGHVATYLANDGEVDLSPAHQSLRQANRQLALPVIDPAHPGRMEFHHWPADAELSANRYGILEPAVTRALTRPDIAGVLLPLVAFTSSGDRLGMGGGYYDRWIAANCRSDEPTTRPILIGIGFELQRAERLPVEGWDQRLDYVVSERKVYDFD